MIMIQFAKKQGMQNYKDVDYEHMDFESDEDSEEDYIPEEDYISEADYDISEYGYSIQNIQ